MGWYTNYKLAVEVDGEYDLVKLRDRFYDEKAIAFLTNSDFDCYCGLDNLELSMDDKNIIITTNQKSGRFSALQTLVNLVKYVMGNKVRVIKGELTGEDAYADMQRGDGPTCLVYVRRRVRSKSI